jgi:hypothetical protein
MTKLDLVIERIRRLPQAEQDVIIAEMEFLLDHGSESLLTNEQWAEVDAALADKDEPSASHDEVFARLRSQTAK